MNKKGQKMYSGLSRKSIGLEIKNARKRKKLSQFELAEMSGIDEKQVYRIEAGLSSPKLENFLKIADVLNLDIKYFNPADISQKSCGKEIIALLLQAPDDKIKIYYNVLKALADNL